MPAGRCWTRKGNMKDEHPELPQEPEWAAYVAIDWADQKHVWKLQPAGQGAAEEGELEHTVSTGIKGSQFHRKRRAPLLCRLSRVHTTSMTIRMIAEGLLVNRIEPTAHLQPGTLLRRPRECEQRTTAAP